MVKGLQRRMVEVKLRGNGIFDCACLILKCDGDKKCISDREIIDEANRIISSLGVSERRVPRKEMISRITMCALILLFGIMIGFAFGMLF